MTNRERSILQLLLTRGLGPRTLGRILDAIKETRDELEDIVRNSPAELVSRFGLKADVAHNISSVAEAAEVLERRLDDNGIKMLVKHQESYPSHMAEVLRESAPPVLFAAGNLGLLNRDAVGFCGSRRSSDLGLKITRSIASALAGRGIDTVSGYAAGVDSAAHVAALESGGTTTMVLAEGIFHFRAKPGISESMTEENSLVLSEFPPDARWAAHNAMQRNRTICALSKALVLIESGLDGGTFDAGVTAQLLEVPLFAIDYEDPPQSAEGNRHFLSRGAIGLRPNLTGSVDIDPLFASLGGERDESIPTNEGWLFPDLIPEKKGRKSRRSAS